MKHGPTQYDILTIFINNSPALKGILDMAKQSLSGQKAREALMLGVDAVVNAVKITLGPRGRNVLLARPMQPLSTRDGVTVAKEMANLTDPFQQMGALEAREVADATVVESGDGTTTACVILQAIYREGLKLIDAGAEPLLLADGIKLAAAACAESIKKLAIDATPELVRQAAIISTHGDVELGTMIAAATCKIGVNGVLELQESRDEHTAVEHLEGYYFQRGWRPNQFFARDKTGRKCILKNPLILISERLIVGSGLKPLPDGRVVPLEGDGIGGVLVEAVQARRPLLIIAEGLEGDALSAFATNIATNQLVGGCFVKLPGFGDNKAAALEDLRIAVGARRIHSQTSTALKDQLSSFTTDDFGFCDEAIISPDMTVLINGGANEQFLNRRVKQLIEQSQEATNPFEREQLDHRIARLTGGVAALRVGGRSEPEMLEKKSRAEDCIHTCRGALEQGIVPGGGVALLRAACRYAYTAGQPGFSDGQKVLIDAIQEPARQILRNAGEKQAEALVDALTPLAPTYGYNAAKGIVGDLYEMGIVDPCKVILTALEKAASIGSLLLTTEVLVCDIPEPPK